GDRDDRPLDDGIDARLEEQRDERGDPRGYRERRRARAPNAPVHDGRASGAARDAKQRTAQHEERQVIVQRGAEQSRLRELEEQRQERQQEDREMQRRDAQPAYGSQSSRFLSSRYFWIAATVSCSAGTSIVCTPRRRRIARARARESRTSSATTFSNSSVVDVGTRAATCASC